MNERKSGTYYWTYYLKNKSKTSLGKKKYTKNFKTPEEAVAYARTHMKKWLQADLIHTESIISDVMSGISLNTRGNIMKFNFKTRTWERI